FPAPSANSAVEMICFPSCSFVASVVALDFIFWLRLCCAVQANVIHYGIYHVGGQGKRSLSGKPLRRAMWSSRGGPIPGRASLRWPTSSFTRTRKMLKTEPRNLVLQTDSYKFTHWKQYPPGTQFVYSYLESRGGMFDQTLFFGLQYYLLEYLCGAVVNEQDVREAQEFVDRHIGPGMFNSQGWMHIVREHGGRLPVIIKAVPEGKLVDVQNVLTTIENTDPQCYWLPNYLETLLLKVW